MSITEKEKYEGDGRHKIFNVEKLKARIAEMLGVDIAEVTPEARFELDLGADSLDLIELLMDAEEEYNVEVSDADAEKMVTVQDAINYFKEA